MFKRDDIPNEIEDFEVVFKGCGIAIDLEMIKKLSSFYIHEVGGDEIEQIEKL